MNQDLRSKRMDYGKHKINFNQLPNHPLTLFKEWFDQADEDPNTPEANAFTLSTVGADMQPKSRVLLLKEFNASGFVFYTNYKSQKGQHISQNPKVCMSFFWHSLERQIIIQGKAEQLLAEESEAYFNQRPKASQLAAILSQQSQAIDLDMDMDSMLEELTKQYNSSTPKKPEHWGGFMVVPSVIEFWQGRPSRLHDRVRYVLANDAWRLSRLAP